MVQPKFIWTNEKRTYLIRIIIILDRIITYLHGEFHEPARVVRGVDVPQVSPQVRVPQQILELLALTCKMESMTLVVVELIPVDMVKNHVSL